MIKIQRDSESPQHGLYHGSKLWGWKSLKKKQEQNRFRELRKEKELEKEGRGTLHVEVNEDKDLPHQKGNSAKKTKETNCRKKGSSNEK